MKPLYVSFVEKDSNLAEQVLAHLHTAGIQGHHCVDANDLAAQNAYQISDVVVLDALTLGEQSLTYAAKLAKHPRGSYCHDCACHRASRAHCRHCSGC